MAMSYVFRKAPRTLLPLALRPISSIPVISGEYDRVHVKDGSFFSHQFSTHVAPQHHMVDDTLIKALNSETEHFNRIVPTKPTDFPFKDDPDQRNIFTRELPGEKIQVCVHIPYSASMDRNDLKADVKISKKNGYCIKLEVVNSPDDDDIVIKHMTIGLAKKNGTLVTPEMMSSDVQTYLKKYLEMRGIHKSNLVFWTKYVSKCRERDDMTMLLNGLKEFVME